MKKGFFVAVLLSSSGLMVSSPLFAETLATPIGNPVVSQANAEDIERAEAYTLNCNVNGPCVLDSNSAGIANVTRTATGTYTINFNAGVYSSAPTCTITSNNYMTSQGPIHSTTSVSFQSFGAIATPTDGAFSILCMGPR